MTRNGSPIFYALLDTMANIHDKKSHDYASNDSPYANYQFAGKMSRLFDNPDDAGFIGRIAEKLYRLANLENAAKIPSNESVEDTEIDICVITALWIASRQEKRKKPTIQELDTILNSRDMLEKNETIQNCTTCGQDFLTEKNRKWAVAPTCDRCIDFNAGKGFQRLIT